MKNSKEILLIDDKFPVWKPILGKASSDYGFSITSTSSVEEGLEKLRKGKENFDAVILSLTFPEGKMQGREGLLKVKELDNEIPVIILTAKTDDFQLVSECIRLGAHDYFAKKEVNPDHLFIQIENAIRQVKRREDVEFSVDRMAENNPVPFFLHVAGRRATFQGVFCISA